MKNRAEIIFVILLVHLIAGILLALKFPSFALQTYSAYAIALLLLVLLICHTGYLKFKIYRRKPLISILIYLLIFLTGVRIALKDHDPIQTHYFTKVKTDYLMVMVDEEPVIKGDQIRFKAKVNAGYHGKTALTCSGKLLVTIWNKDKKDFIIDYGDEILIPSRYTPLRKAKNEREFDYAAWLATKNIFRQVHLPAKDIMILRHHQGAKIKAFTLQLRKRQVDLLKHLIQQPEAFAVASTLILGYRSELDKETLSAYSKTGTIHVLSVSGMHVGIIYLILHFLLSFLDRERLLRIIKALLIILLIWFYSAVTGCSPSVLRSALMLSCFIIAKTLYRRSNSYNILAFSAFVLLIDEPLLLYDVGFQLSYSAVWGLIHLQPLIYKKFEFKPWGVNKLWEYLSFSLAAQLATFPLSVYYFHQFPVYFLISNLLVMLPAALIMYTGFVLLVFRLYFLAPLLAYLITFTNVMLKWIAALPYSTISSIWLTKTELALLCLFMGLGISCLHKLTKRRLALALVSLLCLQTLRASQEFKLNQAIKLIYADKP